LLLLAGIGAFALCFVDAARLRADAGEDEANAHGALVAQLRLTDLALFTEARYTRHPSQADLHSAFQDHPLALEHFPTGSLIAAGRILRDSGLRGSADAAAKGASEMKLWLAQQRYLIDFTLVWRWRGARRATSACWRSIRCWCSCSPRSRSTPTPCARKRHACWPPRPR
jgi:hypothetical protein